MGLPVEQLILATNRNDILTRFVNSGIYSAGDVYATISPSMDIQISSNFERYLYYLVDEDAAKVSELMEQMAQTGEIKVSSDKQRRVHQLFSAVAVSEEETSDQIATTYRESGYILDPHTAVGVRAAADTPEAICLATAHPAKFGDAVEASIGVEAEPPPSLQGLLDRETRCAILEADREVVKEYIEETLGNSNGS
jgi:threonine synthase